jgi:hypothetical protein
MHYIKVEIPHLGKVPATLEAFLYKIEVRQEFFSIRSLDPYQQTSNK